MEFGSYGGFLPSLLSLLEGGTRRVGSGVGHGITAMSDLKSVDS
jgi:hypothetical protein